jgi:sulfatase modifying factor 1
MTLALIAGCTRGVDSQPGDSRARGAAVVGAHGGEGGLGAGGAEAQSGADAQGGAGGNATACADPTLAVSVVLTAAAVEACQLHTPECAGLLGNPPAPSQLGIDYGNFPFVTDGRPRPGEYFFAVVAPGYEDGGFFQGAPGNLSDDVPSAVEGDLGHGDTLADRSIVVSADQIPRFPSSHGTHEDSFPPSQFMVIHLSPFDTTTQGSYVVALCPTSATSRCDCAFGAFTAANPKADGGSGRGGSSGTGGGGSGGSEAPDASAGGAGGAPGAGGSSADASGPDAGPCDDMCTPGAKQCVGCGVQTCDATGTWSATVECGGPTPVCIAGACVVQPSCNGLAATCGPADNASCCSSSVVPGGTYYRSYDGVTTSFPGPFTSQAYPATVSDFRLDTYEITVGRFRKFVAAYSQNMIAAGAGKNPNNPTDPGWSAAWNASLPADAKALETAVVCGGIGPTWTPSAGANENRPMTCLDWYEASAFCTWDGGRLPTEAEWNYAAAGGTEQRVYPWGAAAPDCTYANYLGAAGGTDYCVLPGTGATNNVGSESPKGNGKWGQADLAGNAMEWTLDWYTSPYPSTSCTNCAGTTEAAATYPGRVIRGGVFGYGASYMLSSNRDLNGVPSGRSGGTGSRCARNAP